MGSREGEVSVIWVLCFVAYTCRWWGWGRGGKSAIERPGAAAKAELKRGDEVLVFVLLAGEEKMESIVEFRVDGEDLAKTLLVREARMLSRNCGRLSWIRGSGAAVEVDAVERESVCSVGCWADSAAFLVASGVPKGVLDRESGWSAG